MFLVIDGWVFHMSGQRGRNCVLNMIESRRLRWDTLRVNSDTLKITTVEYHVTMKSLRSIYLKHI